MARRHYRFDMPPKPPSASDQADKFVLRMPDGMRDRIADAAKANGRSMNSEILSRLSASLDAGPVVTGVDEERFAALLQSAMREVVEKVEARDRALRQRERDERPVAEKPPKR